VHTVKQVLQACLRVSQADYKGVSVQLLKLTGAFRVAKRDAADHIARRLPAVLSPQVGLCGVKGCLRCAAGL
jgi:hypothetical protein